MFSDFVGRHGDPRIRISSAPIEQPRASAPGSRPITSNPSSTAAQVAGSHCEYASRVDEIDDDDGSHMAGRGLVARFGIDDDDARPGRTQFSTGFAGRANHRIVELAAQLRHPILVDDSLRGYAEYAFEFRVEFRAGDFARAPLEATRLHDPRCGRHADEHAALVHVVDQVHECEGGSAQGEGHFRRGGFDEERQHAIEEQLAIFDVEIATRLTQRIEYHAEHVGKR